MAKKLTDGVNRCGLVDGRLGGLRSPVLSHLTCLILLMGFLAGQGRGQTGTGSIAGTVRDPSGAVVAGAKVTAVQVANNESRTATTNSVGLYLLPFLPPATYRLEAEMSGFQKYVRENIVIDVGLAATVDVSLTVGATTQSITVTESAPMLQASTSSLGEVVSNVQVTQLPINGRNSFSFAALVPGVFVPYGYTQVPYGMFNDQFSSINGQPPNQNTYQLDGGNVEEPAFNGPGIFPPLDSVQEYKVETNNFSAEFANAAGGVINMVSKSGTNQYHGDVYEFLRNNDLDSNDFFSNESGLPIAPYRFNQFGGTFGGPFSIPHVYDGKDRSFFFVSYEGLRWDRSTGAVGTMPTALQRNGDFSQTYNSSGQLITIYNPFSTVPDPNNPGQYIRTPFTGNVIPPNMQDPVALNILKWLPLPDTPGNPVTAVNNYISNTPSVIRKDTGTVRVDQSLTQNQKLAVTFMMNNTPVTRPLLYGAALGAASPTAGNDELNQRYGVLHYTNAFKSNFVMELTSSFIRYIIRRKTPGEDFDPTTLGFPSYILQPHVTQGLENCFPGISVAGLGVTVNIPDIGGGLTNSCGPLADAYQDQANVANFTFVKGAHTLKFGGSYGWRTGTTNRWAGAGTGYGFDSGMTQGPNPLVSSDTAGVGTASYLLGTGNGGSIESSGPDQSRLWHYFGLYLADDWKVSRKLTLNLGVRYDHEAPWKEAFNRITDFSETAPSPLQAPGLNVVGGLEFPGIGGLPRTQFNPSWANVWPRLGFAYRLDNTTVIRGGFGGFTSSISGTGYNSIAAISGFLASTPWINSLNGVNPVNVLSNPFPNGFVYATGSTLGLGTLLGQSVGAMVRDRPFAYALDWNFGVERTLRGNWVLHVAYSASRGVHLYEDPTLDQLPDKYLSEGSALTQLVTNPFYGNPLVTTGILSGPQIEASQLLLPYPQFSQVSITGESFGTSTYNSLQVNLEHRFTNGFHLHTAYTYSKTMDDCAPSQTQFPGGTFEGGGIQDWSDRKGSWSPAVWDTPNNFETDGVYELPFGPKRHLLNQGGALGKVVGGWQLGGIITLQNGSPLSFTTATNTLNNNGASGQGWAGAGSQFPSLTGVSPKVSGSASSKVNEWFNPAAFTQPAPFTYGNVGRTLSWLRGPGYANVDFSLDKTTTISERFSLQFRAEAFNAFNHPWFGLPDTTIGAPGAGVISEQQNSARQIQFALKLLF